MPQPAIYRIDGMDTLMPPQSYSVHNATDEPMRIRCDGEERLIPPFAQIAEKIGDRADGPMLDSKGKPRPGTLIIFDVPGERGLCDGGRPPYWSARDAIKHALGIDTRTGVAVGTAAEKGVSFVPAGCTDAQFAEIARNGRVRYMKWLEKHATDVVSAYDERNNNRVKAGMGRIPGDASYARALAILEAARRRDMAIAENQMKTFEEQMAAPLEVRDDDVEFEKFVLFEAERVAREKELKTDVQSLVENMTKNPEAMALLRQKYKVRKLRETKGDAQTIEDPTLTSDE